MRIYEDNAGAIYVQRGKEFWCLGSVTPDMHDKAAEDARGWAEGIWEPSEENGQTRATLHDELTLIGYWRPGAGLFIYTDSNGEWVAGAGGQLYLGVGDEPQVWCAEHGPTCEYGCIR